MEDNRIGTVFGGYQIIGQLGVGGMGVVYRARQFNLMREVALKLLPSQYVADAEYVDRFLGEARAAAQLNHPNIVQVFEAGVFEGQYFIAMELVQGRNIAEIIHDEKRIGERDVLRILLQAALGLGFAHRAGIIHRDVKPDNLIMNAQGMVKVCDLGLAKWGISIADKMVTDSGMTIGTPNYIAPEQVTGIDVDHRADIYALGATLYYMLTGQQPFKSESRDEVLLCHLNEPLPDPRLIHPDISNETVQLLQRMTEKVITKRIQSMDEVVDVVCQILGTEEVKEVASPEIAKRLAQRFMEKEIRDSRIIEHVRVEKRKRRRKMAILVIFLLLAGGGAIVWSQYKLIRVERRLAELEKSLSGKIKQPQEAPIVKSVDIKLPTTVALAQKSTANKPAVSAQESSRTKPHEKEAVPTESEKTEKETVVASLTHPPVPVPVPEKAKETAIIIPVYQMWQVSISPSRGADEKKLGKLTKNPKARSTSSSASVTIVPQLVQVSSESRGLLKFDVQQVFKDNPNVSGFSHAWLVLTPAVQKSKIVDFDIGVFRLYRAWGREISTSSDGPYSRPEIGGVDWEYAQPNARWGLEGADRDYRGSSGSRVDRARNPSATVELTSKSSSEPLKFDVTEDVRTWLDGEPNYGWIFIGKGMGTVEFFPGGRNSYENGPKLILTFD